MRPSVFGLAFAIWALVGVGRGTALAQAPPPDAAVPAQHHGVPPATDDDRQAAFPDVGGHAAHDNDLHSFVLFDRLEWQSVEGASGLTWDNTTWVGRDLDRLWLRAEGRSEHGGVADADAHVLYGRAIARWWDVVAGVRQDLRPGPGRTWAAVGIQGLAPYWFEVEATAYLGDGWRTALRINVEYELRLSNRVILQPRIEANLYGRADALRGIGAGVSTADPGLRLRYEIRRELAPYLGVSWERRFGGTGDLSQAAGAGDAGVRLVTGVRWWF